MLQSINPTNLEPLASYNVLSALEVTQILSKIKKQFTQWSAKTVQERNEFFINLHKLLLERQDHLAKIATLEMGKPLQQSKNEVSKCAWLCDYYINHASDFLAYEEIKTDAQQTWLRYEPIGAVLAVMPWNFPFWQVFRFAIPTLYAGNVGLLKHSSNVPQCANMIEQLFTDAGFPKGVFRNLQIRSNLIEQVIKHEMVQAISFTGSTKTGSIVASQAASEIKKAVLELGGNDAFIICDDADIEQTLEGAIKSRFLNNGQSCIAAKRFFIHDSIYDEFINKFEQRVRNLKVGDPMKEDTDIGPLAKREFVTDLMDQINQSIQMGASLRCGGSPIGDHNQYMLPTILENVAPGMPAFDDELFGPVASCCKVENIEEAISLANQSLYGLGGSVWSKDIQKATQIAQLIEAGTVSINDIVKSDPRVPFGGIKKSGYGRELALQGIREFVNVKAIHIK